MGKHPYILKKLSDYYLARLLPDFLYVAPYKANYYSTMVAARISIGTIFLLLGFYSTYRSYISPNKNIVKRYKFNICSERYLNYEKEMILFEKYAKDKYII